MVNTNCLAGTPEEDDDNGPEMTPDGRFIAYVQKEGINPVYSSVHLWDQQSGTNVLLSDPGTNGLITTFSRQPVVSPDGRFVAFLSDATNLVANAVSNGFHIYLRDLQLGTIQLVDVDTNGVGSADNDLSTLSLTADGRYVAFDSPDGSLVALDKNHAEDVFVRDLNGGTTALISRRDATVIPQTGNGINWLSQLSVSANGQRVAFASGADDLVPNDVNGLHDVFVRDLVTGDTILASVGRLADRHGAVLP